MDNIITIENEPNVVVKEYRGKFTFTWNNVIPDYTEGFTIIVKKEKNKENETIYVDWDDNLESMRYMTEDREGWEQEIIDLFKTHDTTIKDKKQIIAEAIESYNEYPIDKHCFERDYNERSYVAGYCDAKLKHFNEKEQKS